MDVGDRVMYSARFCRSIGAYAGETPFRVGTVVAVGALNGLELVRVRWDDDTGRNSLVLACNLVRRDRRHLEAA